MLGTKTGGFTLLLNSYPGLVIQVVNWLRLSLQVIQIFRQLHHLMELILMGMKLWIPTNTTMISMSATAITTPSASQSLIHSDMACRTPISASVAPLFRLTRLIKAPLAVSL